MIVHNDRRVVTDASHDRRESSAEDFDTDASLGSRNAKSNAEEQQGRVMATFVDTSTKDDSTKVS